MNVCGTTRLFLPAFLVGLAVATVAGNDAYGWLAAVLTIGVLFVWQKLRGANQTCAISPPSGVDHSAEPDRG